MTKDLDSKAMDRCTKKMGVLVLEGRAQTAPEPAQKAARPLVEEEAGRVNSLFKDKPERMNNAKNDIRWADIFDCDVTDDDGGICSFENAGCCWSSTGSCGVVGKSSASPTGTCASSLCRSCFACL